MGSSQSPLSTGAVLLLARVAVATTTLIDDPPAPPSPPVINWPTLTGQVFHVDEQSSTTPRMCRLLNPPTTGEPSRCFEVRAFASTPIDTEVNCRFAAQQPVFLSGVYFELRPGDEIILFPGTGRERVYNMSINDNPPTGGVEMFTGEEVRFHYYPEDDPDGEGPGSFELCGFDQPGTCDNSCACRDDSNGVCA